MIEYINTFNAEVGEECMRPLPKPVKATAIHMSERWVMELLCGVPVLMCCIFTLDRTTIFYLASSWVLGNPIGCQYSGPLKAQMGQVLAGRGSLAFSQKEEKQLPSLI